MAATLVAVTMLVATKHIWHYWLSVALLIPFVLGIVALGAMYVVKVLATKHPRQ
jgi:hypothetical protein